MITGATKSKVDAIWQKMWEGGITNPIEVISQLTYLMFMRSLDEKELETEKMEQVLGVKQKRIFPESYRNVYGAEIRGDQLRWSRFKDKPAQEMYRVVNEFAFPFIKQLGNESAFAKAMESATGSLRVSRRCLRRRLTVLKGCSRSSTTISASWATSMSTCCPSFRRRVPTGSSARRSIFAI